MKQIILFIFVLTVFTISNVQACSCAPVDEFVYEPDDNEVIVRAKKISDVAHGMRIQIVEQLSGSLADPEVSVWGGSSASCRMDMKQFEIGKEFVFRLYQHPDPLPNDWSNWMDPKEKGGDYTMIICGIPYLNIKNDKVSPPYNGVTIDGKKKSMSYKDFAAIYKGGLGTPVTIYKPMGESVFKVKLQDGIEIPAMGGQIQLISLDGKLNQAIAIIPKEKQVYTLDHAGMPNGVYLVRVQIGKNVQMKKVMLFNEN